MSNETGHVSGKADKARALWVPMMTEAVVLALLDDVGNGVLHVQAATATRVRTTSATVSTATGQSAGSWAGRSVLVAGGTAAAAAGTRERAGALGARVLVNLGARAFVLIGGEHDIGIGGIRERDITLLTLPDLDVDGTSARAPAVSADAVDRIVVLGRGHVMDLPGNATRLALSASWAGPSSASSAAERSWEVDVVAIALAADGMVGRDQDLIFYNQPSTSDGSVRLSPNGDSEQENCGRFRGLG